MNQKILSEDELYNFINYIYDYIEKHNISDEYEIKEDHLRSIQVFLGMQHNHLHKGNFIYKLFSKALQKSGNPIEKRLQTIVKKEYINSILEQKERPYLSTKGFIIKEFLRANSKEQNKPKIGSSKYYAFYGKYKDIISSAAAKIRMSIKRFTTSKYTLPLYDKYEGKIDVKLLLKYIGATGKLNLTKDNIEFIDNIISIILTTRKD